MNHKNIRKSPNRELLVERPFLLASVAGYQVLQILPFKKEVQELLYLYI
jgi:hypothetical protein